MNPLQQLHQHGQSLWYDQMRRSLATSGELARMVREDGLRGMTSNPTIFEKAMGGGDEYDSQIQELVARGLGTEDLMFELMITDIQMAADILRPVYDEAGGHDGFISLEVPPALALDTQATIQMARDLHSRVDRPNVMIKVPATEAGIPAVEELLFSGINVNITLMFSLSHYDAVSGAYLRALRRRAEEGLAVDRIASVASFFVSRVDTKVDGRLDELIGATELNSEREALERLKGKAAVANAKLAYERFQEVFRRPEFEQLQAAGGARVQRPLWASTGTKNKAYSDVLYLVELIGRDTVTTVPDETLAAFRDHGRVADTISLGLAEAHTVVAELLRVGIDLEEVGATLQEEGVKLFTDSFTKLEETLAEKRARFSGHQATTVAGESAELTASVRSRVAQWEAAGAPGRLWKGDGTLWSAAPDEAAKWLGWLAAVDEMRAQVPVLSQFAAEVAGEGLTNVVVCGMGGSSLCPEVLASAWGGELRDFHVLDTTHPDAVRRVLDAIDPEHTLVVVSSKSGGTLETRCQMETFWEHLGRAGITDLGPHFVAITDSGTELETTARERGFRRTFINRSDIGGRYSALSYFGLVPAALLGVDLERFLGRAAEAVDAHNTAGDAFHLGALLGEAALTGRNKLTIVTSPAVAEFGLWAEQLVAESTGKLGRGIVPVAGEPVGAPDSYGADRIFVSVGVAGEEALSAAATSALADAGFPVVTLTLRDRDDLAAQFLTWEVAVAMAGAVLEINPFDQPNVQESKDNTRRVLESWRGGAPRPAETTVSEARGQIADLLDGLATGDYLALQAYLAPDPSLVPLFAQLRETVRSQHGVATTFGWGPRFLHSTGQLHKGGPAQGVFLQLVDEPREDMRIATLDYSFGTLIAAQAEGDLESLREHGRQVVQVSLGSDAATGLGAIIQAVRVARPVAAG